MCLTNCWKTYYGMLFLNFSGLSHREARERTCILCLTLIPLDKNGVLFPCTNLLSDQKHLLRVQKVLPCFSPLDPRLPVMVCNSCKRQLSFVNSNVRKPKLPQLGHVKKIISCMPKYLRSTGDCDATCLVCESYKNFEKQKAKVYLFKKNISKKGRPQLSKKRGRPALKDTTNTTISGRKQLSHDFVKKLQVKHRLTDAQTIGVMGSMRHGLEDRKLVEPRMKEALASQNHKCDDLFEIVSTTQCIGTFGGYIRWKGGKRGD